MIKITKDTIEMNTSINQLDLTDMYRLLHSKTAVHTFSSGSHRTFTQADDNVQPFTNLKESESMQSDNNGIKPEISNRTTAGKLPKYLTMTQHPSK